jgi:membrane protein YqaA with SNARE-associated domain
LELNLWSELTILFFSSLVSATLFPGGSELLLIYYVKNDPTLSWSYFMAVTIGNSLGALITYFMGYFLYWGRDKAQSKHQKSWLFCQKYGVWALLLSWLPVVGDLLPLTAGWLKLSIIRSSLFIIMGKAIRYYLVINATLTFI